MDLEAICGPTWAPFGLQLASSGARLGVIRLHLAPPRPHWASRGRIWFPVGPPLDPIVLNLGSFCASLGFICLPLGSVWAPFGHHLKPILAPLNPIRSTRFVFYPTFFERSSIMHIAYFPGVLFICSWVGGIGR